MTAEPRGCPRSARPIRRAPPLLTLALVLLAGCRGVPEPVVATSTVPRRGAHLYVTRTLQVIPEPDEFIQGAVTSFVEQLVLSGYDYSGTTWDPDGEEKVLEHLLRVNQRLPGTVGIHLVFVEAPIVVGFGTSYTRVGCTIYDPTGQIILSAEFDPPERRRLRDLLLPRRRPDVDGRHYGERIWEYNLSFFFPRRG